MTNEVDIGSITNDRKLELIPPSDPRVQCAIAPFNDDMLSEIGLQGPLAHQGKYEFFYFFACFQPTQKMGPDGPK